MKCDTDPSGIKKPSAGRIAFLAIVALAAFSVLLMMNCSDDSDADYNGNLTDTITYAVVGDTLTVTGTGDMPDYQDYLVSAPWKDDTKIKHATISDGITKMGSYTFQGNTGLTDITLGADIATVGAHAFSGCTNVTKIVYRPANITDFTYNAADDIINVTDITFADTVRTIPILFTNCTKIENLVIPATVEDIVDEAFIRADTLKSVDFGPVSMERTKSGYIFSDEAVFTVKFAEGLKILPAGFFNGCCLESFMIPSTVEKIDNSAFYFSDLKSVTIPASVKAIGAYAFNHCRHLESITFEGSVERLGGDAFSDCPLVKTLTIPKSVNFIGEDCFDGMNALESIDYYATDATLPEMADIWGFNKGAVGFTIHFAAGTTIPGYMFGMSWNPCKEIVFDGTTIKANAFTDSEVPLITFGDNLTTIEDGAFSFMKFTDAEGNELPITVDNLKGKSFMKSSSGPYVYMEPDDIIDDEDDSESEDLKTPAIALAVAIAAIALGSIIAFRRQ